MSMTYRTRNGLSPRAMRSDDGAVAVIVAVVISVALIGVAAIVIDMGSLYQERRAMQTAADAAALAGVQELPASQAVAEAKARAYVQPNEADSSDVQVTFPASDRIRVVIADPDGRASLAGALGIAPTRVRAAATALISSPVAYSKGVTPIGITANHDESPANAYGYSWGDEITMKVPGGSGKNGNYGWVDLPGPEGGNGGGWLKYVLGNGGASASLGQVIDTKPGNLTSAVDELATWIGFDDHTLTQVVSQPDSNGVVHINHLADDPEGGCHRLILVPMIVNLDPSGKNGEDRYDFPNGSGEMQIIGFAQFFVTYAGGHGSNAMVKGKFIRTVSPEEVTAGQVGSTGQVHYGLVE